MHIQHKMTFLGKIKKVKNQKVTPRLCNPSFMRRKSCQFSQYLGIQEFGVRQKQTHLNSSTAKQKEEIKTEKSKDTVFHEEPVKIIEVKDTVFKEGKAKAIKELSNELDSIEKKADEVYEKVKKKKKDKKKKKNN